jgi:shikimate kinase
VTPPDHHVVLIGTMGSGKSTVGRLLASMLGLPFWDNDDWLFHRDGRTAAAIASQRGADALHQREADVLLEGLDHEGPAVVAAAASAVLDPRVRDRLRSDGLVVWLHAAPGALEARLADPGDRPSLGSSPARLAGELQRARGDLYRDVADREVDTTDRKPEDVAAQIMAEISARRGRGASRDQKTD